ncbi:hypothetical protein [Pseudoalteromonas piratica]|uniref:Uncharacterized protein n=1 Tax=Pseudoalteromonas piratica TaxID=1348114 RepID=A0A0A7EEW7_9GAMM|nr:hypothetical protein [Pseudoalteromonas piratica]AIY65215.1 hypothetical protein OM33_08610 [Pseudoalteromonas piratica]
MSDYTVLPKQIANALEKEGVPLSQKQELVMAGYLSAVQMQIEAFGLDKTIKMHQESNNS